MWTAYVEHHLQVIHVCGPHQSSLSINLSMYWIILVWMSLSRIWQGTAVVVASVVVRAQCEEHWFVFMCVCVCIDRMWCYLERGRGRGSSCRLPRSICRVCCFVLCVMQFEFVFVFGLIMSEKWFPMLRGLENEI
jgi:hypothetical protein